MSRPVTPVQKIAVVLYGVVIGPFYLDQQADEVAKNVFRLLSCLGINCSSISHVSVNPKEGFAKVGLITKECEDYLVDVFNDVGMIMNLYDLRRLTERPEHLVATRLSDIDSRLDKRSAKKGYEAEDVEEDMKWTNNIEMKDAVVMTLFSPNASGKDKAPGPDPQSNEHSDSSSLPASHSTFHEMSSPENTFQGQPTRVDAKTSTPFSPPCDCPETIFYHYLQHIGTETRHAEFKRGQFILTNQREFRNTVGKYVCSFLNSEGGTLYFGVTDDGRVRGLKINKNLEEDLRNDIRFTMRIMEPSVEEGEYTVNFALVIPGVGEGTTKSEATEQKHAPGKRGGKECQEADAGTSSDDEDIVEEDAAADDDEGRAKVLELCVRPRKPPEPENMFLYKGLAYLRRDGSVETLYHE